MFAVDVSDHALDGAGLSDVNWLLADSAQRDSDWLALAEHGGIVGNWLVAARIHEPHRLVPTTEGARTVHSRRDDVIDGSIWTEQAEGTRCRCWTCTSPPPSRRATHRVGFR